MHCKNCGEKFSADAKFCTACGKMRAQEPEINTRVTEPAATSNSSGTIKCGNCDYIGPGIPGRRIFFTILAWFCVLFAPLITIIYFVATPKYRCPRCKSTFLGVQKKDGTFSGRNGSGSWATIIIVIFFGIAVIGILSSIVLASLNSARIKGRDARRIADIKQLQLGLELYYNAKGAYPFNLNALSSSYMATVPEDPAGGAYSYSQCSSEAYHLGTSLEQQTNSALDKDADIVGLCDSDTINGSDTEKCSPSDVGSGCFDVIQSSI